MKANPAKSIYGFSLNRKKPGHFNLSFLAKKGSSIQTWVRIVFTAMCYLLILRTHSLFEWHRNHTICLMLQLLVSPNYVMLSKSGMLLFPFVENPSQTIALQAST